MKLGGVLAEHHSLAQLANDQVGEARDRDRVGFVAADDLDQVHVAGGIEEVGAEEVFAEALAAALADLADGQARGVGGHEGVLSANLVDPLHQVALDVQPLDNGLDDPVAVGELLKIVFEVSGADQPPRVLAHERSGLQLLDSPQAIGDDSIADLGVIQGEALFLLGGAQLAGSDVEQQHREAGVGHVGGDGRSHGAGADHADSFDRMLHMVLLAPVEVRGPTRFTSKRLESSWSGVWSSRARVRRRGRPDRGRR